MGSEVRLGSGSTKRRRGAESRSGRGPEGKAVGAGRPAGPAATAGERGRCEGGAIGMRVTTGKGWNRE